jgi:hypothetical protein
MIAVFSPVIVAGVSHAKPDDFAADTAAPTAGGIISFP